MSISIEGSGRITGITTTQASTDAASRAFIEARVGILQDEFTLDGGTRLTLGFEGGTYTLHRYDTQGTLTLTATDPVALDFLAVGGGGGGASDEGGAGGGGGIAYGTVTVPPGTHQVAVGAGGAGSVTTQTSTDGADGGDTTLTLVDGTVLVRAEGGEGGRFDRGGESGASTFQDVQLGAVSSEAVAGVGLGGGQQDVTIDARFALDAPAGRGGGVELPGGGVGGGGEAGQSAGAGGNGSQGVFIVLNVTSLRTRVTGLQHPLSGTANVMLDADGGVTLGVGRIPAHTAPEDGDTLVYDSSTGEWQPGTSRPSEHVVDGSQTYMLGADDVGRIVVIQSNGEPEVIVPQMPEATPPAGSLIEIFNEGPDTVRLSADPNVDIQNFQLPPFFIPKYGTALLRRRSTGSWALWGDATGFLPITAEGGNDVFDEEIDDILYRIHVFTSSGALEVEDLGTTEGNVDCLVVAGGGGGGNSRGGGGGAGGLILRPGLPIQKGVHTVTVGSGGLHVPGGNPGTDGGNSSLGSLLVAVGGGGGGAVSGSGNASIRNGRAGGSGGGGRRSQDVNTAGGAGTQPAQGGNSGAPYGFGHNGAGSSSGTDNAAGGGGAGGPGTQGQGTSSVTIGGPGLSQVTIDAKTYNFNSMFGDVGDLVGGESWFASGGAGQGGLSRPGGGGEGSAAGNFPGKPNTGGGGGGSSTSGGTNGGSGIVIVRYPLQAAPQP